MAVVRADHHSSEGAVFYIVQGWPATEKSSTIEFSFPHCVVYEEHGSKNHPDRLEDFQVENKTVYTLLCCFGVLTGVPHISSQPSHEAFPN